MLRVCVCVHFSVHNRVRLYFSAFIHIATLIQGQLGEVQENKVQQSKHRQPFLSILSRSEMRGRTELESYPHPHQIEREPTES